MQKDPRGQPALQLHHTDVDRDQEMRVTAQSLTAGQQQPSPQVPHHLPYN